MKPGLYLVADNPREMTPVLVEGDHRETQLLIEELKENGIGSFGAASNNRELADEILDSIEFVEGQEGADVGELVSHYVGDEYHSTVFEVLLDLARNGEIYAPSEGRLKTTRAHMPEGDQ